jgi:hypothetical protein
MHPENVVSPQDKLSELEVIYDAGEWSVAEFNWQHEDGTRPRIGIRWNGNEYELGNPQSSGHATWFVLPENLIAELVSTYAEWRAANRGRVEPTRNDLLVWRNR